MGGMSRIGTAALLACGPGLGAMLGYGLLGLGGGPAPPARGGGVATVPVFFYDRADWADFGDAVAACADRGLVRVAAESDASILVVTPGGRRIRFDWDAVRGADQTRAEV